MRVGIEVRPLVEPAVRGLTRYTVNLLRGLSAHPDIELVLFSREPPAPGHLRDVRADVVCGSTRRDILWYEQWLPRELRHQRIDVFHAPADRGLPLRRVCPTVVTVHGSFERAHWRTLFPSLKERLWYWKHEFATTRADALITVSETTRRELIDCGYPADRLHAIHLAAAPEFTPGPRPGDRDAITAAGIDRPYFLCVSGYNAWKNLDTLVQAFEQSGLADHQLVIVAERRGEYAAHLARWRARPLGDRLVTIEADDLLLGALYRSAAACVQPSRWESFGLPLVEAMACGAPLICSRAHALPEIGGDAADYFDPEQPGELAALLRRLATDPAHRQALRTAGLRRAPSFSWPATIEQTIKIYRGISAL